MQLDGITDAIKDLFIGGALGVTALKLRTEGHISVLIFFYDNTYSILRHDENPIDQFVLLGGEVYVLYCSHEKDHTFDI